MTDPGTRQKDSAGTAPEPHDWVGALSSEGLEHDSAVDALHARCLRVARGEAARRSGMNGIQGPELDDLAHQAAADAVVSVLRRLDDFRGESRFTTWAYKFVVLEVGNKFGRHVWRRDGVRLDAETWDRLPDRLGAGPHELAASRELADAVRTAVEEELTPHQRQVFVAIIANGSPLDAVVAELDTNRNAIYKCLFDARQKVRRHLVRHGHLDSDERAS